MTSVLVGVSGGVDSSIAVHLLKQQGLAVEAIIFKQVNAENVESDALCCSASAIEEARDVCRQLGVVLHIRDLRKTFDEEVIKPTVDSLAVGNTPSPCTTCNSKVRAPHLDYLRWAIKADFFATGHYFRIDHGRVYRGADKKKDQSYMVALVAKELFERWLTPLGNMIKPEVRKIADELGLITAHNPDSQDLCFKHLLPSFKRDIVFENTIVGQTDGRPTIGQKRGFNGLRVLNVTEKSVVVTNKDVEKAKGLIEKPNWLIDNIPKEMQIQLRSHSETINGRVRGRELQLEAPAVLTPGQVAAFYDGNQLIGGALISRDQQEIT